MTNPNPTSNQSHSTILLAYSGGLDTSAIIPWLIETYGAEVIAYCSDLGNAPDEVFLRERALKLGAKSFIFEDVKAQFAKDFVYPLMRAGAVYQDDYLLGTAIARPLIGERLAKCAREHGATAVAHGATGKGNDQIRFERALSFLTPEIEIIAPWKIWDFKGRDDLLQYLTAKGFDFPVEDKTYSEDVNLLHRSCEGGVLEQIGSSYDPKEVLQWLDITNDQPSELLSATIEQGRVTELNGKALEPVEILSQLNTLGQQHGVGLADLVEERFNGVKSRGVYETPGGTILFELIKTMKHLCWNKTTQKLSRRLADDYAELVYDGLWHSTARQGLDSYFASCAKSLNGKVDFRLKSGRVLIEARRSETSLYDQKLVSFDEDEHGLNEAARGFCKTINFAAQAEGRQHENLSKLRK